MNMYNKSALFFTFCILLLILGAALLKSTDLSATDSNNIFFDYMANTENENEHKDISDIPETESPSGEESGDSDETEITETDDNEKNEAADDSNDTAAEEEESDNSGFDIPDENTEENTEENEDIYEDNHVIDTGPPQAENPSDEDEVNPNDAAENGQNEAGQAPVKTEPPEEAEKEEEPDEDAIEKIEIMPILSVINDESIVVYNFDEFKSALSENNKYVNIYLGANIDMKALGIEINPAKKRVMISGINPINGSGPYTINEYNSLDPVYTIRVVSNNGTKEVIMKNVNITGRNYYGAVCSFDTAYDVKITFENVNYNGPQISYNRNGIVRITGNSAVRIIEGNGLSSAQELAEAKGLELGGNTVIDHYAPVVSGVWLVGNGSYIKILSGSNVKWNETGTYMIFQDNLTPAQFIMEDSSRFTVNTLNGLFYNNSELYHQFGDVLIGNGAALEIIQGPAATSLPIIKAKSSVRVLDGASLIISSQGAPELIMATGEVDLDVSSPDTLVLRNKTGKLIDWNDTENHNISIISSFMNYWKDPCNLEVLGSFDDSPLHRWRKRNGEDLSVNITANSGSTISVVSNYTDYDYGAAPSKELLNLQSARLITAGKMQLVLDAVMDKSEYISGETQPYAALRASYTNTGGENRIVFGSADSGGAFVITLKSGDLPLLGSKVEVISSLGYKSVIEDTIVTETEDDLLMFMHVPDNMPFPKTSINLKKKLIPRADDDWHIIIGDTRQQGSEWSLYARLLSPMSGIRKGREHVLESAVVYFGGGEKQIMDERPVKVAEGIKTIQVETPVKWANDEGIFLDIDTLNVYSNVKYTARLEWILVDGP